MIVSFRYLRILCSWGVLLVCVVQGERALALDLNQASRSQLLAVKGIGAKTADRILSARSQRAFASLEDFVARVPGFGAKKRQALREQNVTVGTTPIQSATGNRPAAASGVAFESPTDLTADVTGGRTTSLRNPVAAVTQPAMPMLIRPRPRQPACEHEKGMHTDRRAHSVVNTRNGTASAGIDDKIH